MKKATLLLTLLITLSYTIANAKTNSIKEEKTTKVEVMTDVMFTKQVFDLDGEKTNRKYKSNQPMVIDLYATWCGPCKEIAPILEELAKEYSGKILFYKVDVDQNKKISKYFNANAIPLVIFISKDGELKTILGSREKEGYKKVIEEFLLK